MSFKYTMITEEETLPLVRMKTRKALREKIKAGGIPKDWYFYNRVIKSYFFKKEKITQAL